MPSTVGIVASGIFTPLDLSPALWLDASDTSTIISASGKVSQWNDKSENGRNVTQSTSSAQPSTGSATINSLNVLSFSGSNWLGASTASNWTFMSDGSDYSVFLVIRTSLANPNTLYYVVSTVGSGASVGCLIGYDDRSSLSLDNAIRHVVKQSTGPLVVNNLTLNDVLSTQTPTVLTITGKPNASTSSARSTIRINSTNPQSRNAESLAVSSSAPTRPLTVGAARRASDGLAEFPFVGDIAELVIVNGALTATQRELCEKYMMTKWGI